MLDGEFVLPAVMAVIVIVYLTSAIQLGPPMRNGTMTASFFPIATAIVVLIALAFAMAHALRGKATGPESAASSQVSSNTSGSEAVDSETPAPGAETPTEAGAAARDESPIVKRYLGLSPGAIGVIVLTAGYLVAFDLIGYFVATFIYVLLLTGLFSGGFKQQLPSKLIATVIITLAGYLLFEIVFQVRLPTLWS